MTNPIDWQRLRADFPILEEKVHGHPLIYFDNAASSQKPRAVIDAIVRYYEHSNANVHRGIHELSDRATGIYEDARSRAAKFIHARHASEIIFTRGTTEGLNLVAATWALEHLKPGDAILLTEMEHHSNLVPWQMVARRTGARIEYLPVTGDEGALDLSTLDEKLGSGVKLLAVTHVSNTLAVVNPVLELCERARRHGVVSVIDAAQSAGHLPLDVQEIGCDFLAFSGHKICGPTGIGVLYGRKEILENLPPYQGGGEMISKVGYQSTEYNVPPHRFEAGTPDIAGAAGLHAALDYLDVIGRGAIFEHDRAMAEYLASELRRIAGARVLGPHGARAGLVSFTLPGAHALDFATMADQRGVALRAGHHCNQPLMEKLGIASTLRASFYFYNSMDEVDRFLSILHDLRRLLA